MKPIEPSMREFAGVIADLDGIDGVNALLVETDRETETVKLTIEGEDVDFQAVEELVADYGGSVHSVDEVVVGERLVEESETHQDP